MNVITILCDTLRRDHCGPYNHGKPLNQCWSREAPDWVVPTPNMDRLAARGVTFENCFCGSTPCMPARRDIYTGRYEFLERGWGPLEEDDIDLPRLVSGPPNQSMQWSKAHGHNVSYLISDHFHLWEQGAGNYHMGYSGFDLIRGCEADAYYTDPVDFFCPEKDRMAKTERHFRNKHFICKKPEDTFTAQNFIKASDWITRNREHKDFYLHIDCFSPHEPLDPPEEYLRMFDADGYDVEGWSSGWPYDRWEGKLTQRMLKHLRARYAAKVVEVDRWLGHLMDTLDRHDMWKDTIVILTTDHGTFNGDHGRTGKLQTHEFDAVGHIPFIVANPFTQNERRQQLVQLVDIFPTVLGATGKPVPELIHGVDLMPVLKNASAKTRDYALMGQFGKSVSITDGNWILHQSPKTENKPLNWYGYALAKFLHYGLGAFNDGKRPVINEQSWDTPTWLSDKRTDMNELVNLADKETAQVERMQLAMKQMMLSLKLRGDAAAEQCERLGL
ncbi:MAG: sulfatase [Spirochaetes bacterium]|nr:sulfatase [Spirochaetota bacterium]